MHVVIAGGHGKIALILERLLSARGDSVAGLIRNPAQVGDLGRPARPHWSSIWRRRPSTRSPTPSRRRRRRVRRAGPGSGAARKQTVDRDAAILLADAAEAAGVERYVMISAMAADPQATADDEVFQAYLRAKGVADEAIRAAGAEVDDRPSGPLTNDAESAA